jgi:hypothetical protein
MRYVIDRPMGAGVVGAALAVILFAAATSVATAQEIPRTRDGKPDLNGIWQTFGDANWNLEPHTASQGAVETLGAIGAVPPSAGVVDGGAIPYLPEARAQRHTNFANRRTEDPEAKCFRPGIPRATYMPYPFQIVQTDDDIMIVYQYAGAVRNIFMNEPVPALVESWMGWSNGRWDGDTLVVEVEAQLGQAWLDRAGNYGSATLRVTERYTPLGPNHIRYEATLEDPAVYSKPWTISVPLYRHIEPNARLLDFKCVEFAEELMYHDLRKPGTGPSGGSQ